MQNRFKAALALSTSTLIYLSALPITAHAQSDTNSFTIDGTTFSYNQYENGTSASIQDARGVTTTYQYNNFGLITEEQSAERGTIQYDYDENGNITEQRSEGGLVLKKSYDDQNRIIREVMKQNGVDRKVNRYKYDDCDNGEGRLCKVNSNGHVTRYDYNENGDFTKVATKYDGEDSFETIRYFYGDAGELTRMRYPTGLVVSYHYSEDRLVNRVTGRYETGEDKARFVIANNISFDPSTGNLTNLKFGNGLKLQQSFDAENRIVGTELFDGSARLDSSNYSRNDAGSITSINRLNPEDSVTYGYDARQRLISEQMGEDISHQTSISYGYDAVNNRTRRDDDTRSKSYNYAPSANQLDEVNRKFLSYDERGNLLADRNGKRNFDYDSTNRLTAYYKQGELKASYDYNAFGRRIRKTVHNSNDDSYKTLHFAYAPNGGLLSEFGRKADKANRFARDYVWLGNMPIAQIERKVRPDGTTRKAKTTYIHTDHLLAPQSASDEGGQTVWQWNRDAFGQGKVDRDVDGDGNNTTIRLRFPGQYSDRESGLFYNHFRDYDPKLGRYIQSDPIGLHGGINRYAYVSGNPVNLVDPTGLLECVHTVTYEVFSGGVFEGTGIVERAVICPGGSGGGGFGGYNNRGPIGGFTGLQGFNPNPGGSGVTLVADADGETPDGEESQERHDFEVSTIICDDASLLTEDQQRAVISRFTVPRPRGFLVNVPPEGSNFNLVMDPRILPPFLPGGFVNTRILNNGFTGVNTTIPGFHAFAGTATRNLTTVNGQLIITTRGVGTAGVLFPESRDALNQLLGPGVFRTLDQEAALELSINFPGCGNGVTPISPRN